MNLYGLLAITVMGTACSDDSRNSSWWRNEKEIIELKSEIELASFKADRNGSLKNGLPEAPDRSRISHLEKEIESLLRVKTELTQGILELENGWETFRADILRQRRRDLVGKTFDEFQTANGRTYNDAVVTRIDDGGVSLRHSAGTSRLRFNDLSTEEHVYFGLDGDLAATAHLKESKDRADYDRWISTELAAVRKKEDELARTRKQDEEKRASLRALAANTRASSSNTGGLSSSIGRLGETTPFYSSYRGYSSYRNSYSRPRTRYVYYYNVPTSRTIWNSQINVPNCRPTPIPSPPFAGRPPSFITKPFSP